MDFALSQEHQLIVRTVREFAEREIIPYAAGWDEQEFIPASVFTSMGELGLFGLPFPEEYGGVDADSLAYALAVEEVSRGSGSLGLSYAAHVSLGTSPFYRFGSEEQKRRWLIPCAQGDMLSAFALTEPNAGSDAGATETTAVLEDDRWVINGSKCFITNGSLADVVILTAVTERGKGHRGISNLIVPTDSEGFRVGSSYHKLGLKGSDTVELFFDDCSVPQENVLGTPGQGFGQFLEILDGGRIGIAAMAVGIAQASLEASLTYARQRVQFGKPIGRFQAIQFKLADMAMEIEMARHATWRAAWLKDQGKPFTKEAAMAKLFASEVSVRAALEAVQIHGGYGYTDEFPVGRYLRDAKLTTIGEGTSEILRLVIARRLQEM